MPLPTGEEYAPGYTGEGLTVVGDPFARVAFPSLTGELTCEERDFLTAYHQLYMQGAALSAGQRMQAVHDGAEALRLFEQHLAWCKRLPEGEKGGEYQHTLANIRWVMALLGVPEHPVEELPQQAPTVDEMRQALLPDIAEIVARTVAGVMAEMGKPEAKGEGKK